jgi:subtilase family serine protease
VGTYYVIAKADADNAVAETQEGNNTVARLIQIGADLIVSAITVPFRLAAGGSFVVASTTSNQGAGDSGASVTQFYLSTDAQLDANDTVVSGSQPTAGLAAGTSGSGSTTITIPTGLASGSYYFFAKADAGNAVGETQENNNTVIRLVAIGPDLIVSSVFVTSPAAAGAQTSVTDTVTNQGGAAVGSTMTRFYLSTNITLDAADVPLAESRSVPALTAGASSSGTTLVAVPSGTASGIYYVLAKADADGSVNESAETNNTAPRGIQIVN